jgi:hypothetical protein
MELRRESGLGLSVFRKSLASYAFSENDHGASGAIAVAESAKNQLLRDFRRRSIFDFATQWGDSGNRISDRSRRLLADRYVSTNGGLF